MKTIMKNIFTWIKKILTEVCNSAMELSVLVFGYYIIDEMVLFGYTADNTIRAFIAMYVFAHFVKKIINLK